MRQAPQKAYPVASIEAANETVRVLNENKGNGYSRNTFAIMQGGVPHVIGRIDKTTFRVAERIALQVIRERNRTNGTDR